MESPRNSAAAAGAASGYSGQAQIAAPMPPGMGPVEVPMANPEILGPHQEDPTQSPRFMRTQNIASHTPVPTSSRATRSLSSQASPPLQNPKKRTSAGEGDPWARAREKPSDANNNAMLEKMADMMNAMQQTFELLTHQLAELKQPKVDKEKEADLQSLHHKDVDKPVKYSGQNWMTWHADFY